MITAFFFQGFLTYLIAILMYYVSGHWARLKSFPGLVIRHIIRTRRPYGIPSLVGTPQPTNPLLVEMVKGMIILTSDIQTLTGIALMIAALSQHASLTAYHAMQVVTFGWTPSQAHHLAFRWTVSPKPFIRHQHVRCAAIAVYGILYTTFCVITYVNLRDRWNLETYCFRSCTDSYCLGGFRDRDSMEAWTIAILSIFLTGYIPVGCSFIKSFTWFRPSEKYGWSELTRDIILNSFVLQMGGCASVATTLVGVCGYRKANKDLLNDRDAEEKWGFGQVIAVASLLLLVFEFWKAYVGKCHSMMQFIFENESLTSWGDAEYKKLRSENLNGCHCACSCGKRTGSLSTQGSKESSPC